MERSRRVTVHFFLIIPIILVSSYLVWNVNVKLLQHNRNFYRALNFHILEHDIIDIYWFGQGMLNYPINEYYSLEHVQEFMQRMYEKMSNLELLTYGEIDQSAFNRTFHTVELYYRKGETASYVWTLEEGLSAGEPFSFDNLAEIKAVLNQVHTLYFNFHDVHIGQGYLWDLSFKVEVPVLILSPSPPPQSLSKYSRIRK
jgi:hypothetical protein